MAAAVTASVASLVLPEPDKEEQERVYREQRELGKTHEYADAYAKKIHEGEVFARHFAQIRERRLLNNRDGARRATMRASASKSGSVSGGAASGERRGSVTATDLKKRTPDDFIFKKTLGEGSYSTVFLATEKKTNRDFAIKVLEKNHIKKEKKTKYVMTEKEVFNALNHPFVVKLFYTFQDDEKLYFVISYCANGELTKRIKQLGSFDEECTRFYAAEVVLALEHMHGKGIIHRDLKPENILLDENMHVQITDFGTAKILGHDDDGRSNSFVGTAQYVSPELLTEKHCCKSSDLWALGCIIYQLLSGKVPFRGGNEYQTFKKISALDYSIPEGFPETGKDLVEKLLLLDPDARIGSDKQGGYAALKAHPFFAGVDWDNLYKTTPPRLDAYLPPINPQDRPLHGADEADDEIEDLLAKAYQQRSGAIEVKSQSDRQVLLEKQAKESPWHSFCNPGELIVLTGIVDKRKGLFSKRRVLILTDTPRLFYIDPETLNVMGEIPWSKELWPQYRDEKTLFIHTPSRTYYLQTVDVGALKWTEMIRQSLRMQEAKAKA